MTTPLLVQAGPDAEQAGAVGAVVASLPVSFAPADGGPDVVALAGTAGWTAPRNRSGPQRSPRRRRR